MWFCKDITDFSKDKAKSSGYRSHCTKCRVQSNLLYRHGINLKELAEIKSLSDKCEICGRRPKHLNIDHDHKSGLVRGLLCARCNKAISCFCSNVDLLRSAMDYLSRTPKTKIHSNFHLKKTRNKNIWGELY